MNLFKRVEGVFFNPRPVFEGLTQKPLWADVLVLILVVVIAFTVLVGPFVQKDNIKFWKDAEVRMSERMGEEAYARRLQNLENPTPTDQVLQILGAAGITVVFLLFQSLILLILGRFVSTSGTYKHVFSALLHASLVDRLLGNAVRAILAFTKQSVMQTSTGMALFFPKLEITSTPYIVLANIDFFQLWLFGILGYGFSAVFKIDLKKALFLSYTFWFLKTLANIGLGLIGMSFMR
jgi:hypothetical protein